MRDKSTTDVSNSVLGSQTLKKQYQTNFPVL
jgi:hypothetical protein